MGCCKKMNKKMDPFDNDEVNVAETLAKLWAGKKIIITFVALGVVMASLYAYYTRQVWTSSATIAPPLLSQVDQYYFIKTSLDSNWPFQQNKMAKERIVEDQAAGMFKKALDADKLTDELFRSALNIFESDSRVKLLRPDGQKQLIFQVLSSAEDAKRAQKVLISIFQEVNQKIVEEKKVEIQAQRKILETALYYERQKIAEQAKAMRSSEIAQLRLALDSAKRAGLNEKQLSNYTNLDSPALNFLLGAKFIQARLSTLQEMPLVYPARYLEIKAQLDELKKLDNISLDKMQGFQVVVAPSLPAQRDAPKRERMVIIGAMVGFLLGCLGVLGRETLNELREKF